MTSTTDPSAPIKGLANTQHDALTSDDMLRGVGAREAEGTTLAPSSAQQVEGTGEAFVNAARDLVGGARERTADLTSSGGVGAWVSEAPDKWMREDVCKSPRAGFGDKLRGCLGRESPQRLVRFSTSARFKETGNPK